MEFVIPKIGKFACVAIQTNISFDHDKPIELGNGTYVFFNVQFDLEECWIKSLGTLQAEQFSESNLFLFVSPYDEATSEDKLVRFATSHLYGLLLQGRGYSERGLILAGLNTHENMSVNSVFPLHSYYEPNEFLIEPIDARSLETSVLIAKNIETIYVNEGGQDYLRLRKGFDSFLNGIKELQSHARLHQFVRSIEAIVKPKVGCSTRQFKHRCQFFAGSSSETREILSELYELRSAAEHLNPLREKLTQYPPYEQERIILSRTYQAELLASHIYRRVFTEQTSLDIFVNDESIAEFWQKPDSELKKHWGTTINLETAVIDS